MRVEARAKGRAAIGELEALEVVVLMLDERQDVAVRGERSCAVGWKGFVQRTAPVSVSMRCSAGLSKSAKAASVPVAIQRERLQEGMRGGVRARDGEAAEFFAGDEIKQARPRWRSWCGRGDVCHRRRG
jgi:hypothetical protein